MRWKQCTNVDDMNPQCHILDVTFSRPNIDYLGHKLELLTLIIWDTNFNCESILFLFFSYLIVDQHRQMRLPLSHN